MIDNGERSGPHRRLERWLAAEGITFESEREFPPYRVDIYLTEWHLAIEVDGPYHLVKRDRLRAKQLEEMYQMPTLRLNHNLSRGPAIAKVKAFIEAHAESVDQRKQR